VSRDSLTTEKIVRAAIELLDDDGLDGLTMRGLGTRLDSAATAVYWHVRSRDNLVRLAADAVWAEVALPELDATDWRTAAADLATGMHAMLSAHPWLVQALASHLLYGPGKARFDDHTLAVFERAGLSDAEADQAVGTIFTYVLGNAVGAAATVSLTRRLRRDGGDPDRQLREATARAQEIAREFPQLRRRLDSTTPEDYNATPDATFEIGLNALLDGLRDQLVARRATTE
jgi:AcrR family transcriptional regulator